MNIKYIAHFEKEYGSNKAVQIDNLRGVCIVVSLSLHFTTMQTPHKLRLTAALCLKGDGTLPPNEIPNKNKYVLILVIGFLISWLPLFFDFSADGMGIEQKRRYIQVSYMLMFYATLLLALDIIWGERARENIEYAEAEVIVARSHLTTIESMETDIGKDMAVSRAFANTKLEDALQELESVGLHNKVISNARFAAIPVLALAAVIGVVFS